MTACVSEKKQIIKSKYKELKNELNNVYLLNTSYRWTEAVNQICIRAFDDIVPGNPRPLRQRGSVHWLTLFMVVS